MRNTSKLAVTGLVLALSSATFVACKKEKEQNGPSIVIPNEAGVIAGNQTLPPGQHTLRFKLIFQKGSGKDDADLKAYSFTFNAGAGNQTVYANRPAPNGASFTVDTSFDVNGANGQVYTYTFSVVDKNDKTASRSFQITFQDTATPPATIIDSLIGQNYTHTATDSGAHLRYRPVTGSFTVQNRAQANANPSEILFVYFYSASSARHSIISPAILRDAIYDNTPVEWNSPSTQTTSFRSTTGVSFDDVTYAGIAAAYNGGTDVNDFTGNGNQRAECTTGRVIAFRQGTIYGLVRVNSVTSNAVGANLSVKVARP